MSVLSKKKVAVALSGGVDSAVAAFLLKQKRNFEVIGIFMRLWEERREDKTIFGRCCSPQSELRARKICDILNIPFYVVDCRKEFQKEVVNYFLSEQKKGRTPNPCVVCNKEIKFGFLIKKALAVGSDFVATGHYARILKRKSKFLLLKARDQNKDQSYFLWQLSQNQLKRILFPLGNLTKKEVKKIAQKARLPLEKVRESQELCFLGESLKDFLQRHLGFLPGKILTTDKKEIGEHPGLWFFTIGQRKGLSLSQGPWYVLKKDPKRNALIVTKNPKDLEKKEIKIEKVNWIINPPSSLPIKVWCKIRYKTPPAVSWIKERIGQGKFLVTFEKSQKSPTPGQSAVFYKNDEVLGGGIIYE